MIRSMTTILLALAVATPVVAQAPAAKVPVVRPPVVGRCPSLQAQWVSIEKELASIEAAGVADDSAPRATYRAIETSNELTKAQLTLTLMQASGCSLPAGAPSSVTYLTAALTCATDRFKDNQPASCDRSSWKPITDK